MKKKIRSNQKLTLHTETIRRLRDLTARELGHVQGGDSGACSGDADCTTDSLHI